MKTTHFFHLCLALILSSAQAQSTKSKSKAEKPVDKQEVRQIIDQLPACETADVLIEQVGFQCKTQKGGLFEKRQDADGEYVWTDLRNRKTWYISSVGGKSQADAMGFCQRFKKNLPTEAEFVQAESVGFRSIFQPDAKIRFFWPAAAANAEAESARFFSGETGTFENIQLLHNRNTKASVICIQND